jgi:TolA-binding protein
MTDLSSLFEQVRDEQDELRARAGHLARLQKSLRTPPRARMRSRWLVGMAAAVMAVALLIVWAARPQVLEVHVAGSSDRVPVGVWLGAPTGKDLPLDFSDGTRVALASEAEARIVNLSAASVEVELRRGRAHFDVAKRDGSTFSVRAGPFGVLVTGTRFDVSWLPDADALVVDLHEGQVTLSGCGFGEGRQLAAGQTARAQCETSEVSIGYASTKRSRPASARASKPGPASKQANSHETGSEPPTAASAPAEAPAEPVASPRLEPAPWQALARQGAHRKALEAIEAEGFEKAAARASATELMMLADAAQHAGALARARQALSQVRQRFGGSEEAAFASFALGRLEFDGFGAHAQAARWFRTYLGEQPSGAFAREALGRLMEAVVHGGDEVEARRLAKRYLRSYPSGPHAELASRLAAQR